MRILSFCVTALILGTAAQAPARAPAKERGEADLARELAGRVAGKPVNCLSLGRIAGQTIIDRTAIVYRGIGNTLWVNRPRGAEMLRDDDIPVQFVYGSELCQLDQIKLLDRGTQMQRGFVGLGEFVPYTKPAATGQ